MDLKGLCKVNICSIQVGIHLHNYLRDVKYSKQQRSLPFQSTHEVVAFRVHFIEYYCYVLFYNTCVNSFIAICLLFINLGTLFLLRNWFCTFWYIFSKQGLRYRTIPIVWKFPFALSRLSLCFILPINEDTLQLYVTVYLTIVLYILFLFSFTICLLNRIVFNMDIVLFIHLYQLFRDWLFSGYGSIYILQRLMFCKLVKTESCCSPTMHCICISLHFLFNSTYTFSRYILAILGDWQYSHFILIVTTNPVVPMSKHQYTTFSVSFIIYYFYLFY